MFLAGGRPTARQMNTIINVRELWNDPTFACTTTAYANFTNGTLQFTKQLPPTLSDIRVWIFASAFLEATPNVNHTLGVNIASTDYDVTYQRFNTAQQHFSWSRARRIHGINQGTHTIQVRAKNDIAARQVTYAAASGGASGGALTIIVEEILL